MILDSDNEWGYFIDPETFAINPIEEEIPHGSFVIIKEREYIEDIDRTVIQTTYGIVEEKKFQPLNKRELSSAMSIACANYILNNKTLPPKVKLEKELVEDKPAQLAFLMSNYDVFHLKISSKILSGNDPFNLINDIIQSESSKLTLDDREEIWKVEYAKSSRSTCRTCNIKIEKDKVRIGEPHYFGEHLNYRWHHEECFFWSKLSLDMLDGLDDLGKEDRKRINSHFK